MTEILPDSAPNDAREARVITVNMPAGKVVFPAWVAAGFIESVFKHDREVYGRHIVAVQAGEEPASKRRGRGAQ